MLFLQSLGAVASGTTTTANTVAQAITGVDLSVMLEEVVNLLPALLPTIVGFLAVRKGISFLIGMLRRA